jgi:hypothetical protein
MKVFNFLLRHRGVLIFLFLFLCSAFSGFNPATIDLGIIALILALSADGPAIFGWLSNKLRSAEFLTSSQGKALLMAVPIKTMTVFFGAGSSEELSEVALSATCTLVVLAVALALMSVFMFSFSRWRSSENAKDRREWKWVVFFDILLVMFLILMGSDGEFLFGAFATSAKSALPFFEDPFVRGALAIIPVKTVSTLVLAESGRKRFEIATNGAVIIAILAGLAFVTFITSVVGIMLAILLGCLTAFIALLAMEAFKSIVADNALATE